MSQLLKPDYHTRALAGDLRGTYRLLGIVTNNPNEYINKTSVYGVHHIAIYVTIDNKVSLFDYEKASYVVMEYYLNYRGTERELCYSPDLKQMGPFWSMCDGTGKFPWVWALYDLKLQPAWHPPIRSAFTFGCLPICTLDFHYETLRNDVHGMGVLYSNYLNKR